MNFEAICNTNGININKENIKKFYDKYIKQYKKISVPFIQ